MMAVRRGLWRGGAMCMRWGRRERAARLGVVRALASAAGEEPRDWCTAAASAAFARRHADTAAFVRIQTEPTAAGTEGRDDGMAEHLTVSRVAYQVLPGSPHHEQLLAVDKAMQCGCNMLVSRPGPWPGSSFLTPRRFESELDPFCELIATGELQRSECFSMLRLTEDCFGVHVSLDNIREFAHDDERIFERVRQWAAPPDDTDRHGRIDRHFLDRQLRAALLHHDVPGFDAVTFRVPALVSTEGLSVDIDRQRLADCVRWAEETVDGGWCRSYGLELTLPPQLVGHCDALALRQQFCTDLNAVLAEYCTDGTTAPHLRFALVDADIRFGSLVPGMVRQAKQLGLVTVAVNAQRADAAPEWPFYMTESLIGASLDSARARSQLQDKTGRIIHLENKIAEDNWHKKLPEILAPDSFAFGHRLGFRAELVQNPEELDTYIREKIDSDWRDLQMRLEKGEDTNKAMDLLSAYKLFLTRFLDAFHEGMASRKQRELSALAERIDELVPSLRDSATFAHRLHRIALSSGTDIVVMGGPHVPLDVQEADAAPSGTLPLLENKLQHARSRVGGNVAEAPENTPPAWRITADELLAREKRLQPPPPTTP